MTLSATREQPLPGARPLAHLPLPPRLRGRAPLCLPPGARPLEEEAVPGDREGLMRLRAAIPLGTLVRRRLDARLVSTQPRHLDAGRRGRAMCGSRTAMLVLARIRQPASCSGLIGLVRALTSARTVPGVSLSREMPGARPLAQRLGERPLVPLVAMPRMVRAGLGRVLARIPTATFAGTMRGAPGADWSLQLAPSAFLLFARIGMSGGSAPWLAGVFGAERGARGLATRCRSCSNAGAVFRPFLCTSPCLFRFTAAAIAWNQAPNPIGFWLKHFSLCKRPDAWRVRCGSKRSCADRS